LNFASAMYSALTGPFIPPSLPFFYAVCHTRTVSSAPWRLCSSIEACHATALLAHSLLVSMVGLVPVKPYCLESWRNASKNPTRWRCCDSEICSTDGTDWLAACDFVVRMCSHR